MNNFFKPANLLFYFLFSLLFFFAGLSYAGLTDAGEGQGLAGGAIVLGYGIAFAFGALVISVIVANTLPIRSIKRFNKIIGVIVIIGVGILAYRFFSIQNHQTEPIDPNRPVTKPASFKNTCSLTKSILYFC